MNIETRLVIDVTEQEYRNLMYSSRFTMDPAVDIISRMLKLYAEIIGQAHKDRPRQALAVHDDDGNVIAMVQVTVASAPMSDAEFTAVQTGTL